MGGSSFLQRSSCHGRASHCIDELVPLPFGGHTPTCGARSARVGCDNPIVEQSIDRSQGRIAVIQGRGSLTGGIPLCLILDLRNGVSIGVLRGTEVFLEPALISDGDQRIVVAIVAVIGLVQARLKQRVIEAVSIRVSRVILAVAVDVRLVASAVAVAFGNVAAAAIIDGAWTVAHTARVVRSIAVVHIVTNAISVAVFRTNARVDIVADAS